MPEMSGEARIHVEASPDQLYDMITDVSRMGEWSPETIGAEWVGGATGPAVGAKFKGRNKAGFFKWSTTPEVTVAERGKEFAFKTSETNWSYRFVPAGDGTEIIERFDVDHYPLALKILMPMRRRQPALVKGMQATLLRIKTAVEQK